jgi:hypothetical protein
MQFPEYWADQAELNELIGEDVLRYSINDFHRSERPWSRADLIIERLVEDDGQ